MLTLLKPSFKRFQRKFEVDFENGRYRVRTIESAKELAKVFALRYEVFHKEYCGKKLPWGWDCDAYDLLADHLVVVDRESGDFVGTYRFIHSDFSNRFYSETEFEIGGFLASPARKLELGRACVRKRHRNGITMAMLWKGLLQYLERSRAELLFGCSSIQTVDPSHLIPFLKETIAKGQTLTDDEIRVQPDYHCLTKSEFERLALLPDPLVTAEIPALLKSYLKAGAKVCREPALDRAFQCLDLFTVLDTSNLQAQYRKRFGQC